MLFPKGTAAAIPIIAARGTNGKTTTARMIARMCRAQRSTTRYTTTEGIYINGRLFVEGDCSGPASARFVLKDASVEIAVLVCTWWHTTRWFRV
jgi:cyanophycin synthetase